MTARTGPTRGSKGFHRVFAGVTLPNSGSEGLHEAMGFQVVGDYHRVGYKFGGWHDVRWYERALRQDEAEPREPVAVGAILGSAAWLGALAIGLTHYRPGSAERAR